MNGTYNAVSPPAAEEKPARPRAPAAGPPLKLFAAALISALCLAAWFHIAGSPYGADRAAALHALLEALYVAGIGATFSIAWYAPRGEYRRTLTFVACLCVPAGFFGMLHFLTYPGMPDLITANNRAMSFYFERLAHIALPFALLTLALASPTALIPARQRWASLIAMGAICLLLAAHGFTQPGEQAPWLFASALGLRIFTIALFLLAAYLARHHAEMESADACYLYWSGILGALAEGCLIPDGKSIAAPLDFLGHIYGNLAVFTFFIALYGEAVRHPYAQLRQARDAARCDAEHLGAILRATADGLVVTDADLHVLSANPVTRRLVGKPDVDPAGMHLRTLLAPLDAAGSVFAADAAECVRHGRPRAGIHHVPTAGSDGAVVAIEYSVAPLPGSAGGTAGSVLALRDVTGQWRLQQQLIESATYARNLFESTPDAVFAIAPDGIVNDVNLAAEQAANTTRRCLIGSRFAARFTEPARAHEALEDALAGAGVRDVSLALEREDGGILHVNCSIAPHYDDGGRIKGAFAILHDLTDMHQAQIQLHFQANHDALTALPNRRAFRERVERAIARTDASVAVMVVDLDDFKDVNDTLGPTAGDELLKAIGERLDKAIGDSGLLARLGGDEFAVLVVGDMQAGGAERLADELRATIAAPLLLAGRELIVNSSIGISCHPDDSGDADTLLKNADTAVYHAKRNGKNHCQRFKPAMNDALQRRVDIARHLRHALARGELAVHYQPQIHLQDDRTIGIEALLRWHSAELGNVSPAEFIPVAEDSGQILPIGAWVLEQACRQAAAWRSTLGIDLVVSVNLSARQFRDENLADKVAQALAGSGLPPHLLELELTESMVMQDAARAVATMERLRSAGAKLSIDDFGTGYSSLAYLKRFPIDSLKIDRSFVMDITRDANDAAIVRSILAMAHGLGLKVVAEGVETDAQLAFLHNYGCDIVQGYFISRPLAADGIPAFLAGRHELPRPAAPERPLVIATESTA